MSLIKLMILTFIGISLAALLYFVFLVVIMIIVSVIDVIVNRMAGE